MNTPGRGFDYEDERVDRQDAVHRLAAHLSGSRGDISNVPPALLEPLDPGVVIPPGRAGGYALVLSVAAGKKKLMYVRPDVRR